MDLKGKMDLVIVYRLNNIKFDRTCKNEEELKAFINDILFTQQGDIQKGFKCEFEILEVINNLGY